MINHDMSSRSLYVLEQDRVDTVNSSINNRITNKFKEFLNKNSHLIKHKNETILHLAITKENSEFVDIILAKQIVDINIKKFDEFTALYLAVCYAGWGLEELEKYLPIIQSLLAVQELDVNLADKNGNSPLHIAVMGTSSSESRCKYPSPKIVQMLLNRRDICINSPNSQGRYPLTLAISSGFLEITNLILNDPRTDLTICGSIALFEVGRKAAYYSDEKNLKEIIDKNEIHYGYTNLEINNQARENLTIYFSETLEKWRAILIYLNSKISNL